jgi:RNA polymerase sigma-70 factor (ECF subfamily)
VIATLSAAVDEDSTPLIVLARQAPLDARAMDEFVRRTSPAVWRICAALTDRGSADDLTQDTYLRAVPSLCSFRGDGSPVAWLATIARRVCAEEIARRQRERDADTRLRHFHGRSHNDPGGAVDLADAISRLCPERRTAFLVTAVAGFSYAEAAEMFACPVGTIRSRVARARDELISALNDPASGDAPAIREEAL